VQLNVTASYIFRIINRGLYLVKYWSC